MATFVFSGKSASWKIGSLPLGLLHAEVILNEAQFAGYHVDRVVHYKEKTAIGHEFHALHLRRMDDPSREIIVRIDRRPTTRKVASSSDLETDDSISPMEPDCNYSQFYHISTTHCDVNRKSLTVLALCEVCAFIRNAAPIYSLVKAKHCYWFCAAFLIRLRMLDYCTGLVERGPEYKRRGRFRGFSMITEDAIEEELTASAANQPQAGPVHTPSPFPNLSSSTLALGSSIQYHVQGWVSTSTLVGHTHRVRSVCFTPDGRHLLSASDDLTVRIWDVDTGMETRPPLGGHTDEVDSVAVSPDGRHIASACHDKRVRIWDLEAAEPLVLSLRGHTRWVRSVAFSPDGRKVVSGSNDNSVRIWDIEAGVMVAEPLLGHSDDVLSVAWSLDGSRIVSGSADTTVRIWDAITGNPVGAPLCGHTGVIYSVCFSPDGASVVSGAVDEAVRMWDVASGRSLGEPWYNHTDQVWAVAFSPDGRWLASGSADKTVRVWRGEPGPEHDEMARLDAGSLVLSVAWSPAGDRLAAACKDGNVRMWQRTMSEWK